MGVQVAANTKKRSVQLDCRPQSQREKQSDNPRGSRTGSIAIRLPADMNMAF
jgi:hypothetical protein